MKKWKVKFWPTSEKRNKAQLKEMLISAPKVVDIRKQVESYYPESEICSAVRAT